MVKAADAYPSDFFKAEELMEGGAPTPPQTFTIEAVDWTPEFDDGSRQRSLKFIETEKTLGLNKTNWNLIAKCLARDDDDHWLGAQVTLYAVPQPRAKSGWGVAVQTARFGQPGNVTTPAAPQQAAPAPAPAAPPAQHVTVYATLTTEEEPKPFFDKAGNAQTAWVFKTVAGDRYGTTDAATADTARSLMHNPVQITYAPGAKARIIVSVDPDERPVGDDESPI